jgi:hypothetical protein
LAGQFGCSVNASGATIQETFGRLPDSTSDLRTWKKSSPFLAFVPVRALSYRGLPGTAVRYWLKYSNELSP